MVQEYLLGGSSIQNSMKQHIFGYTEPKISDLYNEKSIWEGRELFLDPFVSTVYNEWSP
jgi:hypothetical protein